MRLLPLVLAVALLLTGCGSSNDNLNVLLSENPSANGNLSPTSTPTQSPTITLTAKPTVTPTVTPTSTPTVTPTAKPAVKPTANATSSPTPAAIPTGFMRWSNPQAWDGRVPADNANVIISSNQKIALDRDIKVNKLQIDGQLECADTNLNITATEIMVHGSLTCGTTAEPYTKNLTVILTGNRPADLTKEGGGMGNKVIGVMMNGVLSLHGQNRTSWLMLDATAEKDDDQITLSQTSNWIAGDQLVITSTSANYKEAEVVTIKAINGKFVTLNEKLKYRHFGEIQTYSNTQQTWNADTRAEVGLLTRNIKIMGDMASVEKKYGGHIMVMNDAKAYLSGIEMTRMGQYAIKGRYPFHWHLVGDATGQYIRNSAIYDTYNRCITVHGTNNTLVDNNVCFKHWGHGFFLEDGVETGNVFNHNLGLWTMKPPQADALIPSDFESGPASRAPATFWISNGDNTFTNNAAAGSDGLGYWYDTENFVTGDSAELPQYQGYRPDTSKFGKFKDNRAHSVDQAITICNNTGGHDGYEPSNRSGALIENLTLFQAKKSGVWVCAGGHQFENMMFLDSGALVTADPSFINHSLFVSNSKLSGDQPQSRPAFGIYDFGTFISNSHLVNYDQDHAASTILSEIGGATSFLYQGFENISRENSDLLMQVRNFQAMSTTGTIMRDVGGSFSGRPGTWSIVPNAPLMTDNKCQPMSNPNDQGVLCPYYYGMISLETGLANLPTIALTRSDLQINNQFLVKDLTPRNKITTITAYAVFAPLNQNDYYHIVDFKSVFTNELSGVNSIPISARYGLEGDTLRLAIKNLKSTVSINQADWAQVNNLNLLIDATSNAWFKENGVLHLKFVMHGNGAVGAGATSQVTLKF